MNKMLFFDRQDRLRRVTRRLLFLTATGSMGVASLGGLAAGLAHYQLLSSTGAVVTMMDVYPSVVMGAATTLAITIFVVFFRLALLHFSRRSARRFFKARDLNDESEDGGLKTTDQQLLNVVQEMAIASTTPAPHVFLLEDDASINSFAMVQRSDSAIIGVTAGARDILSRDELQALIAHEFAHISNGDAAINIRLLALIQGFRWLYDTSVLIIGYPFRVFDSFKFAFFLTFYLAMAFGAFYVLGLFGVGVARLMQAAIARQREFLADASAVQFTRDTFGLLGALEKADHYRQSRGRRPTQVAAFMMFVSPYRARSWLFRTHPTIEQRIEAAESMTPGNVLSDRAPNDDLAVDLAG